jgi:hypothetical protein
MTTNKNTNTQTNSNHQSVHVTVNNVMPRRRYSKKKQNQPQQAPPAPPSYHSSVYYPQQSTSTPSFGQDSAFATAQTNAANALQNLQNHIDRAHHLNQLHETYLAETAGRAALGTVQDQSPDTPPIEHLTASLSSAPPSEHTSDHAEDHANDHASEHQSTPVHHYQTEFSPYMEEEDEMSPPIPRQEFASSQKITNPTYSPSHHSHDSTSNPPTPTHQAQTSQSHELKTKQDVPIHAFEEHGISGNDFKSLMEDVASKSNSKKHEKNIKALARHLNVKYKDSMTIQKLHTKVKDKIRKLHNAGILTQAAAK